MSAVVSQRLNGQLRHFSLLVVIFVDMISDVSREALGVTLEKQWVRMSDCKAESLQFVKNNMAEYCKCFWSSMSEAHRSHVA